MKQLFILCTLIVSASSSLLAQNQHLTPATLGVGGAGVAHINNYNANFLNPANLMLPSRTNITFGFAGFSNSLGGGMANIGLYNKYFTTNLEFDADLSKTVSDEWFGEESDAHQYLGIKFDIIPFGFTYKSGKQAFSFASRVRLLASTKMSKGFFDLGLNGFDPDVFNEFKNVSFSQDILPISEVSVGYARLVFDNGLGDRPGGMKIYAGIAPKYIMAFDGLSINFDSELRVQNDPGKIEHNFTYSINASGELADKLKQYEADRDNPNLDDVEFGDYLDLEGSTIGQVAGTGFGLDFGVTVERNLGSFPLGGPFSKGPHKVFASFSITDLGSVTIKENATQFSTTQNFVFEGLEIDFDRINAEFDSSLTKYMEYVFQDSIGSDIYGKFASLDLSDGQNIKLPGMIQIGTAYYMGKIAVFMDLYKGFNNYAVNSKKLGFAIGTEYRVLKFLPLRVGMRTGGHASTGYSFGTGLDFKNFELTLAANLVANSETNGTNISAAFSGLKFRF